MSKTTNELRQAFIDFFARNDHEVVPSASVLPKNDPTLMFNNAGMVQFKEVFTGKEARPYSRATSSQKCIRISGKHNDLEEVGPSPRHHTFFEMLGNFSFGDYFKEEAIVFAWDFLTKELGLPPERMIFTYFKGAEGIAPDETARELWRKITGFGDDRILGLGMDDNFWQMGDTGPCGPCSEVFFCSGAIDPSTFHEGQTADGLGWMEIWNLVFMQFERSLVDGQGKFDALPKPSIDTGAGLERLASVVQGKTSNYEIDLLRALIDETASIAKKTYGATMDPDDVSMRVIADHARTTAFLIAEGVMPDRTGREYVLRRVMRRAVRHGHRLGIQEPFLSQVTAQVIEQMGGQYRELRERAELIKSVTDAEEVRFRQTVERGLQLLDERFDAMASEGTTTLNGSDAFKLYDTYGFPVDLTEVICRERGLQVDLPGYDAALEEARQRSDFKGVERAVEGVYREALEAVPGGSVRFTGYDRDQDKSRIVGLIVGGELVERVEDGDEVDVVVEKTPFYGESGGQIGDLGALTAGDAKFAVNDTVKPIAGLVVHRGKVGVGSFAVGDEVELAVDVARRERTRRNHSATHLLHWALREVLGAHAQQKGSLVGPDRLRFDFTHNQPLTADEVDAIERLVNEQILKNSPIMTEVLTMDQARERSAMMIFEEKYGDVVRMLTMGPSTELCGGTHARATGDIGLFKISSEQGVAAGVRRILATTGEGSFDFVRGLQDTIEKAAAVAKSSPDALLDKLGRLVDKNRSLEREVAALQKKLLEGGGGGGLGAMLSQARDIDGVQVLGVRTDLTDRGALRELAEQLRDKLGDSVVVVGSESEGKAQLVATVAKSLTNRYRAGELIKVVAERVGGSGGGRPDMAQAGGTDVAHLDEALESIYSAVARGSA